ncbi:DNA-processing protein DprA [Clostridium tyrobutyricum]|uniref:DNA-processing protein DprA n=1 Tax=Clostridium tyrobutyricum TaxID=1519 RepID=UPI001C383DC1|nr:DNA-processing protein DprA [Clostridium tyrobutyricum]MBV4414883.1 DNA-processing protein DprA [Clostridium tyrobutyricum]MBV4420743.1 DNA-processing protein DprA [Clostridium tyrobutyricum]
MNIYDLWFSIVNLPNRIKVNLIKRFENTEEIWMTNVYHNKPIQICSNNKQNLKMNSNLKLAWDKERLENIVEKAYRKCIKSVNLNDKLYPQNLKEYMDAPVVMFYIGDITKLNINLNVAIVGSRKCSIYGRNVADMISSEISKNNINIISGLARGIDAFAHRGCVLSGGYTCAVLGSGIDVIYPRNNEKLYYEILRKGGCIISEFAPGTPPMSYNFPMRNRIISGLSDLVIVVEAGEKSGALITADIALEQGKNIMAVPGPIFSNESKGTNKLIKEGAYPFNNFEDLFQLMKIEYDIKYKENNDKLGGNKKIIYDIIGDTPLHIDDIFRETNVDIKQLYGLLFELQLKNKIICLSGNYYVKVPDKNKIIN